MNFDRQDRAGQTASRASEGETPDRFGREVLVS